MNINPFDILKNAKGIQEQFAHLQEELADLTVTGSAGGGIVKIEMNGQFDLLAIKLDPVCVDPRDLSMLQDLIVAAHTDAAQKVKELLKTKMGPLAGGFPAV